MSRSWAAASAFAEPIVFCWIDTRWEAVTWSKRSGRRRRCPKSSNNAKIVEKSETRDGMRINWDVPIPMDDGLVLRADVFRPIAEGHYPVLISYGPYAKGLAFQEGYPSAWNRMAAEHPDVTTGSTNTYQNWEVVDPEKWVPDGYVYVRVELPRVWSFAGLYRSLLTA